MKPLTKLAFPLAAACLTLLSGCIGWHRSPTGPQPPHEPRPPAPITRTSAETSAPLVDLGGAQIGTATLTEGPRGVVIRLEIEPGGLSPGVHGVRVGERADCTIATQRSAAQYGLLNVYGAEPGSPASLTVTADTPASGEFLIRAATLASASRMWTPLQDSDGSAIIVHALNEPSLPPPPVAAAATEAAAKPPAGADAAYVQPARAPSLGACAAFNAPAAPAPAQ